MNTSDINRAALVLFAAREGKCLEEMKVICLCMRNRVRQGWHDGNWLSVIEAAPDDAGNVPPAQPVRLDPNNRDLQRLTRDIDDIFFRSADSEVEIGTLEDAIGKSCWWMYLDRPVRDWFRLNVMMRPHRASMGTMMLFE